MAFLKLTSTLVGMYLVMNYFPLNCPVEITENMYRNQDLKLAIQKIDELQKIVRAQDDRISTLEKGHNESNSMQWQKYKSWLKNPRIIVWLS